MARGSETPSSIIGPLSPRNRFGLIPTAPFGLTLLNTNPFLQNDPTKTICATMFIVAALQNVKIADLTQTGRTSASVVVSDDIGDVAMTDADERLPDGVEGGPEQVLDRTEERALVRDSTAGFAGKHARTRSRLLADHFPLDWVVSFFRRVFALYENLPEEGGKRNTTVGLFPVSVVYFADLICRGGSKKKASSNP